MPLDKCFHFLFYLKNVVANILLCLVYRMKSVWKLLNTLDFCQVAFERNAVKKVVVNRCQEASHQLFLLQMKNT